MPERNDKLDKLETFIKTLLPLRPGGEDDLGLMMRAIKAVHSVADSGSTAPEHSYPAQLTDALAVWNYLTYRGYGARDVLWAGSSAGGNLALELTLKLKEQGRARPRAMLLFHLGETGHGAHQRPLHPRADLFCHQPHHLPEPDDLQGPPLRIELEKRLHL